MEEIWGIGIENEIYLQYENAIILKGSEIFNKLGRERYSIDYRENYKEGILKLLVEKGFQKDDYYFVFEMLNSHCFDKTDDNFNHKTLYQKDTPPNPDFKGKTILEILNDELGEDTKNSFSDRMKSSGAIFFDGDSIEFITKYFENVSVNQVVNELNYTKEEFLKAINSTNIFKGQKLHYPEYNVGLNMFKTSSSIVLFNNGTYHFHITLPTQTIHRHISDYPLFKEKHISAVYMLQWFEPFFISILGSPDIFHVLSEKTGMEIVLSGGSMRNTMSRYIGIGTYHKSMKNGKILTMKLEEFKKYLHIDEEKWWRTMVKNNMSYNLPKDEIGLDFNINKQYQSGFEFRIFDYFPHKYLENVLLCILLICVHSQRNEQVEWCTDDEVWNLVTYKSLCYGYEAQLTENEKKHILKKLYIKEKYYKQFEYTNSFEDFFFGLIRIFYQKYSKDSEIIKKMVGKKFDLPVFSNFNKEQKQYHFRQLSSLSQLFNLSTYTFNN